MGQCHALNWFYSSNKVTSCNKLQKRLPNVQESEFEVVECQQERRFRLVTAEFND